MKVIVCCKAVPDEESIEILATRELSFTDVSWKISAYDLNAIEEGKRLADKSDGKLIALCAGGAELKNSKLRKDILSRGPEELNVVMGEKEVNDTLSNAKILKNAISQIGDYDLILCGTGSADLYAQQTGNQLGALLGVPVLNGISKIEDQGETVRVERSLDNEVEILELSLPAVISVTSDINVARIPGMKDIMAAGKKKVNEINIDWDDTCETDIVSTLAPEQKERRQEIFEGESEEIIDALAAFIKRELV